MTPTRARKKAGTEKAFSPLKPNCRSTMAQNAAVKTRYSVERGIELAQVTPLWVAQLVMAAFSPQ